MAHRLFTEIEKVVAIYAPLEVIRPAIFAEEAELLRKAVASRRFEFAAGRTLARAALKTLGFSAQPIPIAEGRFPIWPDGVVGSISHSFSLVATAVALSDDLAGIGIDVQERNSVSGKDTESIATPNEQRKLAERSRGLDATILFACKEAVYKSVNPIIGEFLEFHDVEVSVVGSGFEARCRPDKRSALPISSGQGHLASVGGHIVALYRVPTGFGQLAQSAGKSTPP